MKTREDTGVYILTFFPYKTRDFTRFFQEICWRHHFFPILSQFEPRYDFRTTWANISFKIYKITLILYRFSGLTKTVFWAENAILRREHVLGEKIS